MSSPHESRTKAARSFSSGSSRAVARVFLTCCHRSGVIREATVESSCAELALEPAPRGHPLAFYRRRGDGHNFRRLVDGQSAEETQLHQPCLARVHRFQIVQGMIDGSDID